MGWNPLGQSYKSTVVVIFQMGLSRPLIGLFSSFSHNIQTFIEISVDVVHGIRTRGRRTHWAMAAAHCDHNLQLKSLVTISLSVQL